MPLAGGGVHYLKHYLFRCVLYSNKTVVLNYSTDDASELSYKERNFSTFSGQTFLDSLTNKTHVVFMLYVLAQDVPTPPLYT